MSRKRQAILTVVACALVLSFAAAAMVEAADKAGG